MYQGDNICVVVIDPVVFEYAKKVHDLREVIQELAEKLGETISGAFQILKTACTNLAEEIARIAEELEDLDSAPPNLKRPARGSRPSLNLTRRQDLVPWYTSGFQ